MPEKGRIGSLLLVAGIQFMVLLMIAETRFPGYDVKEHYVSDLGRWDEPSAVVFNPSVFVLGLLVAVAGYALLGTTPWKWMNLSMIVSGIGAMGVGLFPMTILPPHAISALLAFTFSNLAAILSFRYLTGPLSVMGPVLGGIGLAALVLFVSGIHLGIGPGGMERMVLYPVMGWMLAFSGYLMHEPSGTEWITSGGACGGTTGSASRDGTGDTTGDDTGSGSPPSPDPGNPGPSS